MTVALREEPCLLLKFVLTSLFCKVTELFENDLITITMLQNHFPSEVSSNTIPKLPGSVDGNI